MAALLGGALLLTLSACASSKGSTPAEKRQYVADMRTETLNAFYAEDATLRDKVADAPGYAVFSSIGTNLILVSTGGGYGVAHNNTTGQDTYMKMGEVGVGIGLGVKDFRALFIFKKEAALNSFIENGWEWGGEADAAAKAGDQGGEASGAGNVNADMEVYQLTEAGLALSATISGTKYWKDDELN